MYKEEDVVKFMYPVYMYPEEPSISPLIGVVKTHFMGKDPELYVIKTFSGKCYTIRESNVLRKANPSEEFVARMEN